jgi:hypothetical protein
MTASVHDAFKRKIDGMIAALLPEESPNRHDVLLDLERKTDYHKSQIITPTN